MIVTVPTQSLLRDLHPAIAMIPGIRTPDNNLLRVFSRYSLIEYGNPLLKDHVYTQDDDVIVDYERLIRMYEPGELLVNMPAEFEQCYREHHPGIFLVGFGAVFPASLVAGFRRYWAKYPADELFLRECDRVFTYLNRDKVRVVDIGVRKLPNGSAEGRMWKEPRHELDLQEIKRRLATL